LTKVLVYSKEGQHRELIRQAVTQMGYKASFTVDLSMVVPLLLEIKPELYIQDWHSLDAQRNAEILRKVHRAEVDYDLIKLVCVEQTNPNILAVAGECGIRKVLSYASLATSLEAVIAGLKAINKEEGEFTRGLQKLRSEGNADNIDSHIDEAFKQFGHLPEVRLEYGGLCVKRDELTLAEKHAEDLLNEDKMNVRAMNLLSRVYMKRGEFDKASRVLEGANILSPDQPGRLVLLGDAFYGQGDTKKAADAYGQALENDPENTEAMGKLGQIKLDEGDVNALLELFSNHGSESEKAGFFNNAAVAAVKKEQYMEALELYQLALKTLESNEYKAKIYFNIALAYRRWGKIEEAFKAAKRSVKYDNTYTKAQRQMDELAGIMKKTA
jgi:tetratricopeptide (TPR) repeat protein